MSDPSSMGANSMCAVGSLDQSELARCQELLTRGQLGKTYLIAVDCMRATFCDAIMKLLKTKTGHLIAYLFT